jgi:predicted DNA binding CopG/RHH family protein
MPTPQTAAETRPRTREIRIRIPESWAVALEETAARQAISVAALVRMIIGPFVRERLQ